MMSKIIFSAMLCFFVQVLWAQDKPIKSSELAKSMERGAEIYEDFCSSCHLSDGQGVAKTFPPLAQSDYLMNNRTQSIKAIKFGQKGEITVNGETYNSVMSSPGLSEDEIADVMNYISNSWGNKNTKMVTTQEVLAVQK